MTRWIVCCLLAILSFTVRADFEASVDRTRLVEGETLELTLESAAANRFSKPELSVLEEHFEIRDMRQLSMMAMLDGKEPTGDPLDRDTDAQAHRICRDSAGVPGDRAYRSDQP